MLWLENGLENSPFDYDVNFPTISVDDMEQRITDEDILFSKSELF